MITNHKDGETIRYEVPHVRRHHLIDPNLGESRQK